MRIVIDARMYGPRRWTGIGRYLQHLLVELEHLDKDDDFIVLIGRENWDEYQPGAANFRKKLAPALPYSLAEQLGLAWQLRRLRPDVVHFAAPNAPLLYPLPWPLFGQGRRITMIHDLTLLDYSTAHGGVVRKWLHSAKKLPFRLVLWWDVKQSVKIVTPTHYVEQQLVARYRVAAKRVMVTAPAMDPADIGGDRPEAAAELARWGLTRGNYVLYVGNCYPYKNVDRLVAAFGEVSQERPDLRLAVVGRDDYFRQQLRAQVAVLGLAERVRFTGAVSDAELDALYAGAAAYVNPSLSEGFGLQGLEAMTHGVPVVAARASCLPEVYGEAAAYFVPTDIEGLVRELSRVLDDKVVRADLVRRGRARVKDFSWTKMAEETLAAYRTSLNNKTIL